ncbi:MAG: hypothetical protein IJZ57_08565 [Clostridia bacterium]|nr:hypothetical protein [Clostridia bacterium]
MDSLNDILSSLSPEDINSLKSIADSVFSSDEKQKGSPEPDLSGGISPEMLMKISNIMGAMNSGGNERCRLIEALKPNLSQKRQKKADEAMQMLKILDILPMLNLLNPNGDSNDKR